MTKCFQNFVNNWYEKIAKNKLFKDNYLRNKNLNSLKNKIENILKKKKRVLDKKTSKKSDTLFKNKHNKRFI